VREREGRKRYFMFQGSVSKPGFRRFRTFTNNPTRAPQKCKCYIFEIISKANSLQVVFLKIDKMFRKLKKDPEALL